MHCTLVFQELLKYNIKMLFGIDGHNTSMLSHKDSFFFCKQFVPELPRYEYQELKSQPYRVKGYELHQINQLDAQSF